MLRKFWLLFAQACTLCLAALFVVATLRPDLLPRLAGKDNSVVLLREATAAGRRVRRAARYADAAKKAMPAVVNIYTSKAVRSRNPLLDDSIAAPLLPGARRAHAGAPRDEPGLRRHRRRPRATCSPTTT